MSPHQPLPLKASESTATATHWRSFPGVVGEFGARRSLKFEVHGEPVAQGSMRPRKGGGKMWVVPDNERELKSWRTEVVTAARYALAGGEPLHGPLSLSAVFRFARPRSHYGTGKNAERLKPSAPMWAATEKDVDKCLRSVLDALEAGGVILNDARICQLRNVEKRYGDPGALIYLEELA